MTNKTWDPLRGKERPDVQQQHDELPVRSLLHVKRDVVSDLNNRLDELGWTPDLSGSLLGRRRPAAFSRLYGPIGLQATRHVAGFDGFLKLAPLVQPNTFILPTTTNIITGRNSTFFWKATHVTSYLSWTYLTPASDPGEVRPFTPVPAGNLLSPVFGTNGGGQLLLNNSGFSFTSASAAMLGAPEANDPGQPKLCFEIELYDKRRGRLLSDGRLPGEMFATGGFGPKELGNAVRIDPDTEIEPRVYITECAMTRYLNVSDLNYNETSVACWINLVFKGYASTEINE